MPVALTAGLALAGAFPPAGFWPLAPAGPALLTLAVWGRRPLAASGYAACCGIAFFVPLLSWLVNLAWYPWLALAAIETVIFGLLALVLPALLRLRFWPVAVAGWWVAQEAVHSRVPWGGFPWGRLAMSQAGAPTAGWAAVGGLPVLTFLLALAGACLAWLLITVLGLGRRGARGLAAGAFMLAAAALVLTGNLVAQLVGGPAPGRNGPGALVAAVQGNVPHSRNLPGLLRATTVTANHAAATQWLARQVSSGRRAAPQLVIWPENSTDIDPALSPPTYLAIAQAVTAINRPVLVGAVLDNPVRNAGQLWLPGRGPTRLYVKRQLVPFGEVIPLRRFLLTFTSLPNLQPRDFTPGNRAVVFQIGRIKLGDVICYEVGYDNLVRSEVLAGANLLTVQTNDATYEMDGQLGESLQQLAMARMDAVTTGRAIVVASTSGVSAIIGPDGRVLARSGTWQRAVLETRVPLTSRLTPADRAGPWPELAIIAATVLALAWSLTRRRPGRATDPAQPSGPGAAATTAQPS